MAMDDDSSATIVQRRRYGALDPPTGLLYRYAPAGAERGIGAPASDGEGGPAGRSPSV